MSTISFESAIRILEQTPEVVSASDMAEAKSIAVAAIRKQIPTPPGRSSSGATLCPSCNRFMDRHEQRHGKLDIPHCKWCGQAIDWKGALGNGKQG